MTLMDIAKKDPQLVKEARRKCKNKQDLKKFAKEKGIEISDSELNNAYAYVCGGAKDAKLNSEELGQVSGGKTSYESHKKNDVFINSDGKVIIQD
ncbi:MAG: hypothetical protein LBI55_04180 [Oscillospiraceae bacterium]|jgi:predicted ribosomally synthesized peptide with nif11-like leader|nr:hypothetical protein [Oscillospiraceae bacterium]